MSAHTFILEEIDSAIDRLAWVAEHAIQFPEDVAKEYVNILPALYSLLEDAKRSCLIEESIDLTLYTLVEAILRQDY